jgi:NTE family protein
MRQIAPISPALHLGAERVMVISVANADRGRERMQTEHCPSLAQVAGHALNSIFLDALEADIERLTRINRTTSLIPPELRDSGPAALKHIDCIVLSPSQDIERIALEHLHTLPRPVRFFLFGIGAMRRSGSNLASYLLFERSFCRALLRLGYEDTMARRDEVHSFLAAEGPRCAVGPGTSLRAKAAPAIRSAAHMV